MRAIFAIFFAALLLMLTGCSTQQSGTSARGANLAGSYHLGGTGYNLYLDLLAGGRYKAELQGCLGVYGTARGSWTLVANRIVLSPSNETDMLKGELRELHLVQHQGQTVFVRDLHDDYYKKYGPDERVAFHRQEKK